MGDFGLRGFTFAQLPIWLIGSTNVDAQGKVVYAYLVWRQGRNAGCWPSMERIAADLGLSRRTVVRILQYLEDTGYIAIKLVPGKNNTYSAVGEPPESLRLTETLAVELRMPQATRGSDMDVTSDTGDTGGVTPMSQDQCHPCHTNHMNEPHPQTTEGDGAKSNEIWRDALKALEMQLGRGQVATLLSITRAERLNGHWVVTCSNDYWRDWLENRAKARIMEELSAQVGEPVQGIEFVKGRVR